MRQTFFSVWGTNSIKQPTGEAATVCCISGYIHAFGVMYCITTHTKELHQSEYSVRYDELCMSVAGFGYHVI